MNIKSTLRFGFFIYFVSFLTCLNVVAQKPEEKVETPDSVQQMIAAQMYLDSIAATIKYQQGIFNLGDKLATVKAGDGFSFLDKKDAMKLLHDLWNNPENDQVLGILVPTDIPVTDENLWAVVFTYEEDGHVKDDDAEEIKYDELLSTMKEQTEANNAERVKAGYDAMHLVGWAQTPFYDKAQHKLHWAKDLTFGDGTNHTLNYNIRMLGRKGVLVLNVVGSIEQLPEIKSKVNSIMASTNFIAGSRYEDFDESNDKIAEYGIAGLIAGGVLAKTGLLAKIGLILVKAWKVIALAVAGGFGALRKFFGRKKKNDDNGDSTGGSLTEQKSLNN
jgi:uncharacterized membrane-anchored protein